MKKPRVLSSAVEFIASEVRADACRRVTLGKALDGLDPEATFTVYRDELGRIVLDPQLSIPAREAWLYRNAKSLAQVRRGLKDAADGRTFTYRDAAAMARGTKR